MTAETARLACLSAHLGPTAVPRVRQYTKNIACLESLWDAKLENRLSMLPLLELTSKINDVRYSFLTCNTKSELRHNLSLLGKKKSYGILLMAFHGEPGSIELAGADKIKLDALARYMGRRFEGWVVHFASCGTIKADDETLEKFVTSTGVAMVMGYSKSVDWTEGAVMDLLVLRWLQFYKDLGALLKHLVKNYPDLVAITGFRAYPSLQEK